MKKTKKVILCIGSVLILTMGIILGQNLPKLNFNSKDNTKRKMIAMYLENEDGGYDLSSQNKFLTDGYVLNTEKSSCKNGGTLTQDPTTKKLSLSVSNSDQCTVYFDKETPSLKTLIALNKTSSGLKTNFDDPATTDEGVFEMKDDYGTSYYYRGVVEDNYVKYGVNASGQEMWWRIIRINGDGSVRILYDGTQGYTNGISSIGRFIKTKQQFNKNSYDNKYAGWMYGPVSDDYYSASKEEVQSNKTNSAIKTVVDTWYKENIEDTGYGINISDEIFCNDRSISSGKGYGRNTTYYGTYERLKMGSNRTGISPIFVCPEKVDAFTVSDIEKGNGALTYPVGLITADEIIAAGSGKTGYDEKNSKYYLYKSSEYIQWSLTPAYMNDNGTINMFTVYISGKISEIVVTDTYGAVAPVINLTPEYASTMIGSGTITDPYRA